MISNDKLDFKNIGLAPGTIVYVGNKSDNELFIDAFDFDEHFFEEKELKNVEEVFSYENEKTVSWINVNGLNHVDAIKRLGDHYGLHPLILEDIANTKQRPKIDEHGDYIFMPLKMLYFDKGQNLKIEHISFILGANYVISFQEDKGDIFDSVRERLRSTNSRIRTRGADYLLYALVDAIVDNYYLLLETLGEKVEHLEDNLFEAEPKNDIAYEIQNLKREILKVRRAVLPLREVVNRIEKSDNQLIQESTKLFIGDLYDHIIQVCESIDIYREMIWGLMDMYMTTISNKMNVVMKVLTIIATIFIPLTFIAGIYGMNFENIPELRYQYGYYILWGVMILIFLTMLYYFKRKKWL
ncbi:MAG: magnesium/cobalt transporter CorA [Saonia sp.]